MENWTFGNILANISFEFQDGFLENPGIYQRKEYFTDINEITTGKLLLEKEKYYDFLNFYKNILKSGTIPFYYYDCKEEESVLMSFIDEPTFKEDNGFYIVSLKLRKN